MGVRQGEGGGGTSRSGPSAVQVLVQVTVLRGTTGTGSGDSRFVASTWSSGVHRIPGFMIPGIH
jgi:hypothetical protein